LYPDGNDFQSAIQGDDIVSVNSLLGWRCAHGLRLIFPVSHLKYRQSFIDEYGICTKSHELFMYGHGRILRKRAIKLKIIRVQPRQCAMISLKQLTLEDL
jgi:hypothetical protein